MNNYAWKNILNKVENIEHPVIAEIGVFRGNLSKRLLENNDKINLFLVDAWSHETYKNNMIGSASEKMIEIYQNQCEENYRSTLKNVEPYKNRVKIIKKMSVDAAKEFSNNFFDIVFIDASHDYPSVCSDLRTWLPKVKIGGYLSGHDYGIFDGVTNAVDEIFGCSVEFETDFTWFYRRIS